MGFGFESGVVIGLLMLVSVTCTAATLYCVRISGAFAVVLGLVLGFLCVVFFLFHKTNPRSKPLAIFIASHLLVSSAFSFATFFEFFCDSSSVFVITTYSIIGSGLMLNFGMDLLHYVTIYNNPDISFNIIATPAQLYVFSLINSLIGIGLGAFFGKTDVTDGMKFASLVEWLTVPGLLGFIYGFVFGWLNYSHNESVHAANSDFE